MAYTNPHPSNRPWNPLHAHRPATRSKAADDLAAHERLKQKILDPGFPCVAARSVINRKTYRFGHYPALGSSEAALAICHDLYEFLHELPPGQAQFSSFFAMFEGPLDLTEVQFEALLWRQLQLVHEVDAQHFEWDAAVSTDPDDPKFSFSVGGRAFFVIGLHQGASRLARTMAQPCLVFNPHDQFETLRAEGGYERLQQVIRQRDMAYQGSVNPVLTNFGQQAESRQYSGRLVPSQWKCPFHQALQNGQASQRVPHDD